MSLLHLLTVGESLQAPKNGPNKFRLHPRGLPKFSSPQVPELASPTVAPEKAKPVVPAGETGLLFEIDRPAGPAKPVEPAKNLKSTVVVAASAPPAPAPASATGSGNGSTAAARPGRWSGELPFLRMYSSNAKRRGPQRESDWEQVRVARNDLSDSDFEVVARRAKTMAGPFTLESAGGPPPGAGYGWKGLVRRLVGWGSKRS